MLPLRDNPTYLVDRAYGVNAECDCLKTFRDHLGVNIQKIESRYSLFDYTDGKIFIELKTRRNAKDKYPTTLIPVNKMNYCMQNPDKGTYYFCFLFTDGLFYWKYTPDVKLEKAKGGRTDRGCNEIKDYYYIPVSILKEFNN